MEKTTKKEQPKISDGSTILTKEAIIVDSELSEINARIKSTEVIFDNVAETMELLKNSLVTGNKKSEKEMKSIYLHIEQTENMVKELRHIILPDKSYPNQIRYEIKNIKIAQQRVFIILLDLESFIGRIKSDLSNLFVKKEAVIDSNDTPSEKYQLVKDETVSFEEKLKLKKFFWEETIPMLQDLFEEDTIKEYSSGEDLK